LCRIGEIVSAQMKIGRAWPDKAKYFWHMHLSALAILQILLSTLLAIK